MTNPSEFSASLYKLVLRSRQNLPTWVKRKIFGMPQTFAAFDWREAYGNSGYKTWRVEPTISNQPDSPEIDLHWKFTRSCTGSGHFAIHKHPDIWCTQLRKATVFGFNGAVLDAHDRIIFAGHEQPFRARHGDIDVDKLILPKINVLDHEYVLIDCPSGGENIFHWLLDALPRIEIARRYTKYNPIALVRARLTPYAKTSLRKIGVKWYALGRNEAVRPRSLIVPSMPANSGSSPAFAVQFLRENFLVSQTDNCQKSSERIFVVRKATRRVLNEDKITPTLDRFGIRKFVLEELSFEEQIRLFQSAELVVAPHGAGLANLVFCQEGAHVIEFFSPNYVNVCFWELANAVGLKYSYLIGAGERPPIGTDPHLTRDDIVIPVREFEDWLNRHVSL